MLNRLVIGGSAADTISLAWFLKSDFDILIIYGQHDKDEIENLHLLQQYKGLSLKKMMFLRKSFHPFFDAFTFFEFFFTIVKFNPQIVHTHGAKPGFAGRIAAWLWGVPVIIHTFHGHFFHSYFSNTTSRIIAFTEKAIGKITTAAIALSKRQKAELVDKFKIFPDCKVSVIQLGFAFNKNNSELNRNIFRNKYQLQPDEVAIGIVGRIVPVKNHAFFVKVIENILVQNFENAPAFFIIGDGELRTEVEKELLKKNIAFSNSQINKKTRVVFTSWITNVNEVMNGLDIVALTSLNEGTPLSIIEAQFFKKPVIATNAGGVADVIINEVSGFVIEQNNLQEYSRKLTFLINNKTFRTTMGEEGNKFISVHFSKQKEIAAIKNLYYSLLTKKGYHFKVV